MGESLTQVRQWGVVQAFVERIANGKHSDLSTVVNGLLRADMKLADAMRGLIEV